MSSVNENPFSQHPPEGEPEIQRISFRWWYGVTIVSSVMVAMGVAILLYPQSLYLILAYAIGGGWVIMGIKGMYGRGRFLSRTLWVITCSLLGVLLILNPDFLKTFLPALLGVFGTVFSVLILTVFRGALLGGRRGRGIFLTGIVLLGISLSVFIYPREWGDLLGWGMGLFLILFGGAGVFLSRYLKTGIRFNFLR